MAYGADVVKAKRMRSRDRVRGKVDGKVDESRRDSGRRDVRGGRKESDLARVIRDS